jgi:hypothetical protein
MAANSRVSAPSDAGSAFSPMHQSRFSLCSSVSFVSDCLLRCGIVLPHVFAPWGVPSGPAAFMDDAHFLPAFQDSYMGCRCRLW